MNIVRVLAICILFFGAIAPITGMDKAQMALAVAQKDYTYADLPHFIEVRPSNFDANRDPSHPSQIQPHRQPSSLSKKVYLHLGTLRNMTEEFSNSSAVPLPNITTADWKDFEVAVKPILEITPVHPNKSQTYKALDHLQRSLANLYKNNISGMAHSLRVANYLDAPLWLEAITGALAQSLIQSSTLLQKVLNSPNLETLADLPFEMKEPLVGKILALNQGATELFYMPDTLPETTTELAVPQGERIRSLKFNRSGDQLFAATDDGNVQQWDIANRKLVHTFAVHPVSEGSAKNPVNAMALSSDDRFLITDGQNNAIQLWNLDTNQEKILEGHTAPVKRVVCNQDNTKLASCSQDGTIRLWNIEDGKVLKTLQNNHTHTWAMAFSPDGEYLASGSNKGVICIWNIKTGECIKQFKDKNDENIHFLQFNNEGTLLAGLCGQGEISIWNPNNGMHKSTIHETKKNIEYFQFSIDGYLIKTISQHGIINLWNSLRGNSLKTVTNKSMDDKQESPYNEIGTFSSGGNALALYMQKRHAVVVKTLYDGTQEPVSRKISLEQALLITASYQNKIENKSQQICDNTVSGELVAAYDALPSTLKNKMALKVARSWLCNARSLFTQAPETH